MGRTGSGPYSSERRGTGRGSAKRGSNRNGGESELGREERKSHPTGPLMEWNQNLKYAKEEKKT